MISDEVEERMQTTNFMRQHVRGARQKVLMEQIWLKMHTYLHNGFVRQDLSASAPSELSDGPHVHVDVVAHRRDALYHQQALNEALVTALDFMRLPSTTEILGLPKIEYSKQASTNESIFPLKREFMISKILIRCSSCSSTGCTLSPASP